MMYEEKDGKIWKSTKDGDIPLTNFLAEIIAETKYVDGKSSETFLTLIGKNCDDCEFPPVTITARDFVTMSWVTPAWGIDAMIFPHGNTKDDIRAAIQLRSKPAKTVVYTHTGWIKSGDEDVYLHAKGGIKKTGNDPSYIVQLPNELSRYHLPNPPEKPTQAIKASFELTKLAKDIGWVLLLGAYRSVICECDFAIHLSGKTGSFKSEVTSLIQSHFGEEMDSRHLPGSWSSTGNALEAQAYKIKNAIFTIDDFIPSGTSWQVRQYQKVADQLIRAQGNQAGRARLTDVSNLQTTYYPRGMILSSGEDVPDGHSVRARMMIMEIAPGDVSPEKLTKAQQNRHLLPQAMASFIKWVANDKAAIVAKHREQANYYRDRHLGIGHSRTPAIIGHLIATVETVLQWATDVKAMKIETAATLQEEAYNAILSVANSQEEFLVQQDPCDIFCQTARQLLTTNQMHLRSRRGGIPKNPTLVGWTEENSMSDVPSYKAHGKKIGWIDWKGGEILFDANIIYELVKKFSQGGITVSKHTLFKRMKDSGFLSQYDAARKRNTARLTCEGATRTVLAVPINKVYDEGEFTNAE